MMLPCDATVQSTQKALGKSSTGRQPWLQMTGSSHYIVLPCFLFVFFFLVQIRRFNLKMPGRCVLLHGLSQLRPGEVRTPGLGGTAQRRAKEFWSCIAVLLIHDLLYRRMNGWVNRQLFAGCEHRSVQRYLPVSFELPLDFRESLTR